MTEFDLATLARQVITEKADATDPGELVPDLLRRIPANETKHVLAFLLRDYIRRSFHSERQGALRELKSPSSLKSGKWGEVRNSRWCKQGEWDHLANFTAVDCRWMAKDYLERAAENTLWATRFDRLADELTKSKVERVGDLSDETIERILT